MPDTLYTQLKSGFGTAKTYLERPDNINKLYLTGVTKIPIYRQRAKHVLLVMDCFSRYLLVLKLYPALTASTFINGLEAALEEAMTCSHLDLTHIITLVTGEEPAMIADETAKYLDNSPFFHVHGINCHPRTRGMIARLVRTINEEEIYNYRYLDTLAAQQRLDEFRQEYNHVRLHEALKYKRPSQIFTQV